MLPDISVDQFRSYLEGVRSKSTALAYSLAAQRFLRFAAQHRLDFGRLPPGVLSLYSEYLISERLSPSSVHTMTAGAKKYLGWLTAQGRMPSQFFSDPDLPKITKEVPNVLKEGDLLDFLNLAASCEEPVRTATLLLPFCGLRSNELTTLKMGSISRVEAPDRNGSKIPFICFTVRGKGGDVRTVPLLPDGKHILIRYVYGWRRQRPGTWLFPMANGEPLSNRTLRHYVQWIREKKSFGERLTPHTLRRTYLTTLWRAGVDIPTLTKIAGHRSVQTTLSHYLEVSAEDLAGAVGRSGAALVSAGPYAETVAAAQRDVDAFLKGLKR